MALKATVCKAELQISDIDRHYYASHSLTLAQHPSETDERLMLRVLAFAANAHERLVFCKGLSDSDEPDLWRKDLTGLIEQWIELGQPDEQRLRQASGRSGEVRVYSYGGRAAELWWERAAPALRKIRQLRVFDIAPAASAELAQMIQRNMQLQCLIQDGVMQFSDDSRSVEITPLARE